MMPGSISCIINPSLKTIFIQIINKKHSGVAPPCPTTEKKFDPNFKKKLQILFMLLRVPESATTAQTRGPQGPI